MGWDWTWGRECKLGWGWNEDLDLLIPVKGKPPNVKSQGWNYWWDFCRPYIVSSTDIQCWVSFLFAH